MSNQEWTERFPLTAAARTNAAIGLPPINPEAIDQAIARDASLTTEEKFAKGRALDVEVFGSPDTRTQEERDLAMAKIVLSGKIGLLSSKEIEEKHKDETDPFFIELNRQTGEEHDRILALAAKLKEAQ